MPSLQIRNLPDDLYEALALRAQQAKRSLAQQALVELRGEGRDDAHSRRKRILMSIKRSLASDARVQATRPEELIRADRER